MQCLFFNQRICSIREVFSFNQSPVLTDPSIKHTRVHLRSIVSLEDENKTLPFYLASLHPIFVSPPRSYHESQHGQHLYTIHIDLKYVHQIEHLPVGVKVIRMKLPSSKTDLNLWLCYSSTGELMYSRSMMDLSCR